MSLKYKFEASTNSVVVADSFNAIRLWATKEPKERQKDEKMPVNLLFCILKPKYSFRIALRSHSYWVANRRLTILNTPTKCWNETFYCIVQKIFYVFESKNLDSQKDFFLFSLDFSWRCCVDSLPPIHNSHSLFVYCCICKRALKICLPFAY